MSLETKIKTTNSKLDKLKNFAKYFSSGQIMGVVMGLSCASLIGTVYSLAVPYCVFSICTMYKQWKDNKNI